MVNRLTVSKKYGESIIPRIGRLKIGIVIPTFGRSEYVQKCFESLKRSQLNNCVICIIDETEANPAKEEIEGFTRFDNVDSSGYDIGKKNYTRVTLIEKAKRLKKVVAFNDGGWLKYRVNPQPSWMLHTHFSLYIKSHYLAQNPSIRRKYLGKKYVPDSNTPKLIQNLEIPSVSIIKIFKKYHGNMHESIKVGFDLLSTVCETLIIMDSDTVHGKDWLSKLYSVHIDLETTCNVPIITSGFNTINHTPISIHDDHAIKRSLGGCNLCMSKKVYYSIVRETLVNVGWDHALKVNMKKAKGIYACTKPSVVQHIGRHGIWSGTHRMDVASDFVPEQAE